MINSDLLLWASYYTGLAEVEGTANNPIIMEIARMLGVTQFTSDTDQQWCGIFMAFVATVCGAQPPTSFSIARNWLTAGAPVMSALPGDVCVLWTGSPTGTDGHVGLFQSVDDKNVWLVGGNQVGAVRQFYFPKERVLGYRRLFRK